MPRDGGIHGGVRPRKSMLFVAGMLATLTGGLACGATPSQAFAVCAACHGLRGEGNPTTGAPALAGQSAAYVQRQLQNFANGLRGTHKDDSYGAQMRAANQGLLQDPKAIAAIASYVAGLPQTSTAKPAAYNAHNGNNLYQGKCGACHGGRAEGNEALGAPRLAGLDAAYLRRQFHNFQRGVRGADTRDKHGRQMALMASATITTERDLDDVIGYIQTAGAPR